MMHRQFRRAALAAFFGLMWPATAPAAPDCLLNQSIGVFVAHTFTDSGGVVRDGTNYGPIYSQLSSRLSGEVGAVMEIGASSGKEALARANDRADLLAFFELNGQASDIPLPGGQRTSMQDVRMQASLRIIDVANRRVLGAATDMVTTAGLGVEATLPAVLPGLVERMASTALTQVCAAPGLPAGRIEVVAAQSPKPDLASQREALEIIREFAADMCQDIPLDTNSEGIELSGEAKAKLSGIIQKIVDLGIEGSGQYTQATTQNVLQKDLASTLAKSTDCKLEIWRGLQDRLLAN